MVIDTRSKSFRAAVAGVALAVWGVAGVAENLRLNGELAATRAKLAEQRRNTRNLLLAVNAGHAVTEADAVRNGLVVPAKYIDGTGE